MDNRPIGFFDSGLGGLTCIPHLMQSLPNESIIYFGDTARTPYGSKAVSTIRGFAFEISDFLAERDVKMIAIACNTVSGVAIEDIRKRHPGIPVLGIISPASHTVAKRCNSTNRIGIIGTKVTVQSGEYPRKILRYNPSLKLFQKACPAFVPLIEEGMTEGEIIELLISRYMDGFVGENKLDTLVLGCTHYPLIRKSISALYPHLEIIDPSEEMLQSINDELEKRSLYADSHSHENIFYASDLSENFVNMIDKIFRDSKYRVAFKSFDLETEIRR
ncbi:MAG: glutamate racemase [Clostridiales Family XIII bacterium]|jgi:glutamate racemase|nr:glutamate racemase [Clostridiales Family XIII bacterium]